MRTALCEFLSPVRQEVSPAGAVVLSVGNGRSCPLAFLRQETHMAADSTEPLDPEYPKDKDEWGKTGIVLIRQMTQPKESIAFSTTTLVIHVVAPSPSFLSPLRPCACRGHPQRFLTLVRGQCWD